jgi:uncharacterized Rmd1/YagE family protein
MSIRPDFKARAIFIADRIDLRSWPAEERLASNPVAVSVPGGGLANLFRYGVVVFFDTTDAEEKEFFARIGPSLSGAHPEPETEEVQVSIDFKAREGMQGEKVFLAGDEIERLQIIADVLSKSVMLAWYEARVAAGFERIEPLATELQGTGRIRASARELSRHVGTMLLTQQLVGGVAEVGDKPEQLWERPDLEGLFVRLEDEFEIRDRHAVLWRKLNLISQTEQTLLQLQQGRHSLRLELYIVVLIVVEIILMLYEMFLSHP